MDRDPVIEVKNLSKAYRIWSTPAARMRAGLWSWTGEWFTAKSKIREACSARARKCYRDFFALRDISFEVRKGEAVGIIGRNGSGKSTLLQIIAGTLQPTSGSARINGKIAALLELGSGFNPEFTGRENVYLNGAVLGFSRAQMDSRFDAIADFADIGDFIDQPVRTYSSGMVVRLAFAVAVYVEPAILIVDEALSVGDARFQLKCARAIDRFIERGVTLLFVSHDSAMVKRLCNRALLLENGRNLCSGVPNDVVNLYSKLMADGGSAETLAPDIAAMQNSLVETPVSKPAQQYDDPTVVTPAADSANIANTASIDTLRLRLKAMETVWQSHPNNLELTRKVAELFQSEQLQTQLTGKEFTYGGELGQILHLEVLDSNEQPRTWFTTGEPVTVRMLVEAAETFAEPIYALTLRNTAGVDIYGTNTLFSRQPATTMLAGTRREVDFAFNLNIMPGHYFISVGFTHFVGEELVVIHRRYDAIKLDVHGTDHTFGIANLKAKISYREAPRNYLSK